MQISAHAINGRTSWRKDLVVTRLLLLHVSGISGVFRGGGRKGAIVPRSKFLKASNYYLKMYDWKCHVLPKLFMSSTKSSVHCNNINFRPKTTKFGNKVWVLIKYDSDCVTTITKFYFRIMQVHQKSKYSRWLPICKLHYVFCMYIRWPVFKTSAER